MKIRRSGGSDRIRRSAVADSRLTGHAQRELHGLERLAHLDARAALKHRTVLRELQRCVEVIRLDDAVATDGVRASPRRDLALAVDGAHLADWVAAVDESRAERLH